jgi:hypothetical protein
VESARFTLPARIFLKIITRCAAGVGPTQRIIFDFAFSLIQR